MPRPVIKSRRLPTCSAWCAQVTVQPESSRTSVLISGRSNGSKVVIPSGGQTPSIGNSARSKNAQKKATKNITSDAMNSIMP